MPTPSGDGHAVSGSIIVAGARGGGRRAGALRVCESPGAAIAAIAVSSSNARRIEGIVPLRHEVRVEELLDAMPGVAQHVLAGEVMELARIRHELHQAALAVLQQFIDQADRV